MGNLDFTVYVDGHLKDLMGDREVATLMRMRFAAVIICLRRGVVEAWTEKGLAVKSRKPSLWIRSSGEVTEILPKGITWTLEEIQQKVGGYFEIVGRTHMAPEYLMLVDEEGELKSGAVVNRRASLMAGQEIVGDVLIVHRDEMEEA